MGRQEKQRQLGLLGGLRFRRLPKQEGEDEHVLDPVVAISEREGPADAPINYVTTAAPAVPSPSVQRKLREREEERAQAAAQGVPLSPTSSARARRRKGLLACVWVALVATALTLVPIAAISWRKYRSPHPIGFGAAWVSLASQLLPLIEHDDEHFLDLQALEVSRRRLDQANHLNIAPAIRGAEDIAVPSTRGNHSIPIRIFRPLRARGSGDAPLKAIVWIHGGGWTVGSVQADDKIARRLAAASGAVVASVEYRLAPEHKYPAQLEDTTDALEWLLANGGELGIDTRRVAVAGESAGGHLTIVTALALGGAKEKLCGIIPVVPATDYGCNSESCHRFQEGYLLTRGQVKAFWQAKLSDPETEQHHHYVSPLRAPAEALGALPPVLLMTAGLDPLRDEGEAFAAKVQDAGVDVELVRYERTIHGFFGRVVTHGNCGVLHAARWFERVCGEERDVPLVVAAMAAEEEEAGAGEA